MEPGPQHNRGGSDGIRKDASAVSLVVATVFVPLSVYLTLKNGNGKEPGAIRRGYGGFTAGLARLYEISLGRLNRGYGRLLALALRRRLDLVLVLLAVFALTAAVAVKNVKFVDSQEEELSGFEIEVRLPQATTLKEAEEFFLEYESNMEDIS